MKYTLILISLFVLVSCSYNKEELPVPGASNGNGTNTNVNETLITYTQHTKKYFDNYCTACHAPGLTQSFFPLTNFAEVSVYSGVGGRVQARVLNQGNMPPSGSITGFLTVAEKDTLQWWINQGSPQ